MMEDGVKKLKHKNIDLVRENRKLRKERDELRQENAELRDRVYNLTMYLHEVRNAFVLQKKTDDVLCVCEYLIERHPGIPGYNSAILEVQK